MSWWPKLSRLSGAFVAIALSACVSSSAYKLPPGEHVEVRVNPLLKGGQVDMQVFQEGLACTNPGVVSPVGVVASANLPYSFRLPAVGIQTAWARFRMGASSCDVALSFEPKRLYSYEFDLNVRDAQCVFSLRGKGPGEALAQPVAAQMKRVLNDKPGVGKTCVPITVASFQENAKTRAVVIDALRRGNLPEALKAQRAENLLKDLEGLIGK